MPGVNRRRLLRNCGAGLSALSVTALSGCNALSGDGGDDADSKADPDGDGEQPSGEPTDPPERNDAGGEMAGPTATEQPPTATSPPSGASGKTAGDGAGIASTARSDVDGLAVEGTAVTDSGDQFGVDVTLRNTGDQTTDIFDYGYELTVYDGSGAEITGNGSGQGSINDTEIATDETATITVRTDVDGSVDAVARYELVVNCSGMFVEGVYCEG